MAERLLTPDALDHLGNLSLTARRVVEGFLSGLHRSPYHGFSLEFAEYRQYMPGDDLRYFEWKALAKSDRCYIKKFQSETNVQAHILLDASASMGYGSKSVSKLRYGAALAAMLVYLLTGQHDAVGVAAFNDQGLEQLPPGAGLNQRHQAIRWLEAIRPAGGDRLAPTLHRVAASLPRRGLVIVISDLFEDPGPLEAGLKHLTFKGHEVIVFQVLDPAERRFPFSGHCEFEDLETGARLQVHPSAVADAVRREVDRFIRGLHASLAAHSIDLCEALTSEPFDRLLAHYLHKRLRRSRWSS
jgi:uncharacterized protein (DUF58 family)